MTDMTSTAEPVAIADTARGVPAPARVRIFSGVKPTGHLTLGNYLGAVRRWAAEDQHRADALFCVVDLHALTVEHDPARVRRLSRQAATLLLAAGLDPQLCTVFVQSHVDEHARLSYLMECLASDGEMRRMIQYKEKVVRETARGRSVRLSLLTYPALMAADILAYGTDEVPVGDDQAEHVELTRDLARRFNQRYGAVFTVPRAVHPVVAARVMDLQDPTAKMGKSHAETSGDRLSAGRAGRGAQEGDAGRDGQRVGGALRP